MIANEVETEIRTVAIRRTLRIAAPIETAFAAVLAEMGPEMQLPDGRAFPMVIEARPGGRWFRDLGGDAGHLWGHVQVIKPPGLIEFCGPMFMSFPAHNHIQYRLTADGDATRLDFTHRALGPIPDEMRDNMTAGCDHMLRRAVDRAERRA